MTKYTTQSGVDVYRIDNSINGNPRYVVHYLSLGLNSTRPTDKTREVGLSKYRGKQFGGGFVFESYNIDKDVDYFINELKGGE